VASIPAIAIVPTIAVFYAAGVPAVANVVDSPVSLTLAKILLVSNTFFR